MVRGTGTFESLEEARAFFREDHFATENGMKLEELQDGNAVCSFEITDRQKNAEGGVMGGAIMTLIDFTFAAASCSVHRPTVAQQASISFLNRPKGTRLSAKATLRKDGRSSCIFQVDVTDDAGRDIATALMTGHKIQG